ncbi:hypothetical protein BDQ17DRAFT_1331245 [Cyathus striatus]|nr:hypothetical protein BDQ17DRAFT_1331245 [Cyathus striatus]
MSPYPPIDLEHENFQRPKPKFSITRRVVKAMQVTYTATPIVATSHHLHGFLVNFTLSRPRLELGRYIFNDLIAASGVDWYEPDNIDVPFGPFTAMGAIGGSIMFGITVVPLECRNILLGKKRTSIGKVAVGINLSAALLPTPAGALGAAIVKRAILESIELVTKPVL